MGSTEPPNGDSPRHPVTPSPRHLVIPLLVLGGLLVLSVPLFLCMPLEFDVLLYDVGARSVLGGAVYYRDYFEINLPGILWLHLGIRSALGWSSEAIRAVDLAFVAAIGWLLCRWLKGVGCPAAWRAWTAVALAAFYFSTSEWCHCQRDTWMLLPVLGALFLRERQVARLTRPGGPQAPTLAWGAVEGFLWAAAVWIKPHALVMALVCWLLSILLAWRRRLAKTGLALDLTGLLSGGLLAALPGVVWLWSSGAWESFWDIQRNWNPEYLSALGVGSSGGRQLLNLTETFFPWMLAHLAAVPAAIFFVGRGLGGPVRALPVANPGAVAARALLAALYLAWLGQALFLQSDLDYHQVPPVFLAIALVGSVPWKGGVRRAVGCTGILFLGFALFHFPFLEAERLALWGRCLTEGSSAETYNTLAQFPSRADWVALERVASYLRRQSLRDGELTCYDAWTISLYQDLGLKPSTRYCYFDVWYAIFTSHRREMRAALAGCPQRFVVSDLRAADLAAWPPEGVFSKPYRFPAPLRRRFPWSQPGVFRAGWYMVHRCASPPRGIRP
jgi:hypothetical protein